MRNDTELAKIIEAEARKLLPSDLILQVALARDVDDYGDPTLWVKIVVKPEFMALDPRRTIPFGPALRFKLWDLDEKAAPVLNYVLEEDYRRLGAAAA